jgi:hypothetical protein
MAARVQRRLSSATSSSSLDELQKSNDLTSRRSHLSSAASDCTSNGDVDKAGPVSYRRHVSFMLLFLTRRFASFFLK